MGFPILLQSYACTRRVCRELRRSCSSPGGGTRCGNSAANDIFWPVNAFGLLLLKLELQRVHFSCRRTTKERRRQYPRPPAAVQTGLGGARGRPVSNLKIGRAHFSVSSLGLDEALPRPDCLVKVRSRHSRPNEGLYSFINKNPMKDESASDELRGSRRGGGGLRPRPRSEVNASSSASSRWKRSDVQGRGEGRLHMMVRVIFGLVQV